MKRDVEQAEDAGGGWVPIVMHHVCDGCDELSIEPATLEDFLDWLAARDGVSVETIHDVMGGPLLPGVPGPPASVPVAADGNLLQNTSLALDANDDGVPDCWERASTGSNAATYTLVAGSGPGSGGRAQRIDMTSYTSGARRLQSQQDLGSCAPSVTPGHTYTMTARYVATARPRFSVSYRTPEGGWLFLAQSGLFPIASASASATASYTTPPLPAGATALSVGLQLEGLGELTTDAYDLRDASP
jgi:hypothetical protein